ncbi:hypothetical protein BDK51DRAFT_33302, partial [Blyttiomyces helicus]
MRHRASWLTLPLFFFDFGRAQNSVVHGYSQLVVGANSLILIGGAPGLVHKHPKPLARSLLWRVGRGVKWGHGMRGGRTNDAVAILMWPTLSFSSCHHRKPVHSSALTVIDSQTYAISQVSTSIPPKSGAAFFTLGNIGYIFGGIGANGAYTNELWKFDLDTPQIAAPVSTLSPPSARDSVCIAALSANTVLLFGGGANGPYLNDTYRFVRADDAFASGVIMSFVDEWGCACMCGGRRIEQHTSTFKWTPIPTTVAPPLRAHSACASVNGNVYLFGGDGSGTTYGDLWQFSASTLEWSHINASNPPSPRIGEGATGVGRFFVVAGGQRADIGDSGGFDPSFYYFDTTTGKWQANSAGVDLSTLLPPIPAASTPSTPSPSSSSTNLSSSSGVPVGPIAGGVAGGVVVLCIVAWLLLRGRSSRKGTRRARSALLAKPAELAPEVPLTAMEPVLDASPPAYDGRLVVDGENPVGAACSPPSDGLVRSPSLDAQ